MVAGLIVVGNQGLSGRFSRMRRFLMGGSRRASRATPGALSWWSARISTTVPRRRGRFAKRPLRLAKVAKQGGLAYVVYGQHPHEVAIPDDRQGLEAALL